MASRYCTLDADALREVVAGEQFAWGPSGAESCSLTLEALPLTWPERSAPRTWARTAGPAPQVPGPYDLRRAVPAAAAAVGATFHAGGAWEPAPAAGPWVQLGPGGQVQVHSGWQGTPAQAAGAATQIQDRLRAALLEAGIDLACLGHDAWHPQEARAQAEASVWATLQERAYDAAGGRGLEALRSTAATGVRVAFGGPVKGPRRWRAAWQLAPRLAALFAHSPLERGHSARCKSARARAWRYADSSRCGIPEVVLRSDLSVHEQYVQFALAARVLWVVHDGQAHALTRPTSFAQWMAAGVAGWYPELADWRAHLATLRPLVRPDGALALDALDAQGRAFAGVPLLITCALLTDDAAIEEVLSRFGDDATRLDSLHEAAARDGLVDPTAASEARELLALTADVLLRAPAGWASPELVAALVAFERAFTREARTPADELLELYLERGALDREDLEGLEQRWCAAAGTVVSWRAGSRPG